MLSKYKIELENYSVDVEILKSKKGFVTNYFIKFLELDEGTKAVYEEIKERLITQLQLVSYNSLDKKKKLTEDFRNKARNEVEKLIPKIEDSKKNYMVGMIVHEMLGLGKLEILLNDPALEEIVINSSKEPAQVYHREFGWLVTNITPKSEDEILNYASIIGRKVGRQITNLTPLLDAHLSNGDRVNATLAPISNDGNTITIRKFRKIPWTISEFISNKTLDAEVAALFWLSMQYELNILVSGGTGTGKTSFLTSMMPFIPPNQRIISIEDTREIKLPDFLHWVPMVTREPNQEGKGKIDMLDLLVNSLRMRPDRIILGEIRRSREAEVLFEAMHTGHSVYSTIHADTAIQTYRRLINPPISIPEIMLNAIDLFVVMFRDRRKGIRRVYEIAEIPFSKGKNFEKINILYRWNSESDQILKYHESRKIINKLKVLTGFDDAGMTKELDNRKKVLEYLVKKKIKDVDSVEKYITSYIKDPEKLMKKIK